ncbi:MAG: hypothetical protein O3A47_01285 [Chloroflexi bacterium]|nr:hypothetical protein [Chloroflexota bacterium]
MNLSAYRVTEEALTSMAKYAEARQVAIHLDCSDKGRGFDSTGDAPRLETG